MAGVPIYTIHHNPEYYPSPYLFKPERFLEGDVETARSAFTPFSIGPRGCIGKAVAYMELRLTLAKLIWSFEPEEQPTNGKGTLWKEGFSVERGEYKLMDHFTSRKEGPVVRFAKRQTSA